MMSILVLITAGLVSSLVIFAFIFSFKRSVNRLVGSDLVMITVKNKRLAQLIEETIAKLSKKVSLDEDKRLQAELESLEERHAKEKHTLETMEKRLKVAQDSVDAKEARQNELKAGREDCERVAAELLAAQEQLLSESKKLALELADSTSQLEALSKQVAVTADHKNAFEEANKLVDEASNHLRELIEIHTQAGKRFTTLQSQYDSLDKEYRNLIEKQLAGGD